MRRPWKAARARGMFPGVSIPAGRRPGKNWDGKVAVPMKARALRNWVGERGK